MTGCSLCADLCSGARGSLCRLWTLLDAELFDVGFALRAGEIHARLHALIPTQKSLKSFVQPFSLPTGIDPAANAG